MKREQNAAYDLSKALKCLQKHVRDVFIMCDIKKTVWLIFLAVTCTTNYKFSCRFQTLEKWLHLLHL